MKKQKTLLKKIFEAETSLLHLVKEEVIVASEKFEIDLSNHLFPKRKLLSNLYISLSRKSKINNQTIKEILEICARKKIKVNFLAKRKLSNAINCRDLSILPSPLDSDKEIVSIFNKSLFSDKEIMKYFLNEVRSPTNSRTKKKDKNLSSSLVSAAFADYAFNSVPKKIARKYFLGAELSEEKYFSYTSKKVLNKGLKKPSIAIITVNSRDEKSKLFNRISNARSELRNHSFIICVIKQSVYKKNGEFWRDLEKAILVGEKGKSSELNYKFIRREDLYSELINSKRNIQIEKNDLKEVYEGLYYQDTFYVDNSEIDESDYGVIIFENNRFNNSKFPCPICHSENVEGNSFSKLGVKSFECKNLLCSEISSSFRGKRFSFYSELRIAALKNEANLLDESNIKEWNRDVVLNKSFDEIVFIMSSFYSDASDLVAWYSDIKAPKIIQRKITESNSSIVSNYDYQTLDNYRKLYFPNKQANERESRNFYPKSISKSEFYLGDSRDVMKSFCSESIDVALTSPPYFNARDYSQWKNIYLYYADMIANADEVLRVLKKGGVYFYNIFNYFDNENDIVLSAMGKKRLILSSVLIDSFEKLGFKLHSNIIWDKGHIEGKRGFNSGNKFPFYQHPFNCWEHILVFSKGKPKRDYVDKLPTIFRQQPFKKIFKGKNTLGHTAPFPIELPRLLTSRMSSDEIILDPYGGSGTTALAAEMDNVRSIYIEKNKDYFNLGMNRLKKFN